MSIVSDLTNTRNTYHHLAQILKGLDKGVQRTSVMIQYQKDGILSKDDLKEYQDDLRSMVSEYQQLSK